MSTYWRKRELEHIKKRKKTDAQLAKLIESNQKMVMKDIEQQIEAFYGRFATVEGITMTEAKKRASKLDIDTYSAKAKRYVKYAHSDNPLVQAQAFTESAMDEMRAYNLTMKVSRLELLKANVALELAAMTSDEERLILESLTKDARKEYERQAGILGRSLNYTEKSIGKIVNSSFLNATWSERLWTNQQALKGELNKLLNRGIVQGKGPRELARDLRKTFNSSIADSERLMITELARIQNDVFMDAANKLGIDSYECIAESGACKKCAPLDGKIFKIKDAYPGVNIYPMHPRCRCSAVPAMDRAAWEADLDKRGFFAKDDESDVEFNEHISSKLTQEHKQHYESVLRNAPKQEKELWEKYQDDLVWANNLEKRRDTAYFKPSQGVTLNTIQDLEGSFFSKPGTIFFHEFGHNIDYLSGNHQSDYLHRKFATATAELSNGKTLGDTVISEVRKMTNTKKGNAVEKRHFLKLDMMKDYEKDIPSMATISDLYGGATDNKLILGAGHDKSYWQKPKGAIFRRVDGKQYRSDKVGNEAFAEMYSASMRNAEDELNSLKKWLPESYEMYQELVGKMLKGGN